MLHLLGVLGSFIKRDSAKFEKKSLNIFAIVFLSNVNALLLSTALKFEISGFCGILRDFRFPKGLSVFQYLLRVYHQKILAFLLQLILTYCILLFCTALYQYGV